MQDGALLVRGMAVGICGTDREIAQGAYGTPPSGEVRLVIGHESLGEVLEAPTGSGFAPGDLIVGIVRRPDPMPSPACAAGEWDMCRTDSFGERGIVRLHGYGSEHWRVEPDFAVPILPRLGELGAPGAAAPWCTSTSQAWCQTLPALPRQDTTVVQSLGAPPPPARRLGYATCTRHVYEMAAGYDRHKNVAMR